MIFHHFYTHSDTTRESKVGQKILKEMWLIWALALYWEFYENKTKVYVNPQHRQTKAVVRIAN